MDTEDSIRARKTLKLRANPDEPLPVTTDKEFKKCIEELITLAGKAPFHHACHKEHQKNKLSGLEPWRFHLLDGKNTRTLLKHLKEGVPVKSSKGLLKMLAAADAVILGTWLPEKSRKKSKSSPFQPNIKNMEHIAATGAAIQNLLLAATARGINAYWSSGGSLRKPEIKTYLNIPQQEILLGAIFLFPADYPNEVLSKPGKYANKRSNLHNFMEWIELPV